MTSTTRIALFGTLAIGLGAGLAVSRHPGGPTVETSDSMAHSGSVADRPDRAPPRFNAALEKGVVNDPRDPDYDAEKLMRVAETTISKVFEAEPRDQAWAPVIEDRVKTISTGDFAQTGVKAKVRSLECRTASCKLVVEADSKADLERANMLVFQYTPSTVMQPDGPQDGDKSTLGYYFLFNKELRQLDKNAEFASAARAAMITRMRELVAQHPERAAAAPIPRM